MCNSNMRSIDRLTECLINCVFAWLLDLLERKSALFTDSNFFEMLLLRYFAQRKGKILIQYIDRFINQAISQSSNQTVSQSVSQSINQSTVDLPGIVLCLEHQR